MYSAALYKVGYMPPVYGTHSVTKRARSWMGNINTHTHTFSHFINPLYVHAHTSTRPAKLNTRMGASAMVECCFVAGSLAQTADEWSFEYSYISVCSRARPIGQTTVCVCARGNERDDQRYAGPGWSKKVMQDKCILYSFCGCGCMGVSVFLTLNCVRVCEWSRPWWCDAIIDAFALLLYLVFFECLPMYL